MCARDFSHYQEPGSTVGGLEAVSYDRCESRCNFCDGSETICEHRDVHYFRCLAKGTTDAERELAR